MYDLGEDGKGKLPRVYHVCKALATFILLVKHKGTISMIAEESSKAKHSRLNKFN